MDQIDFEELFIDVRSKFLSAYYILKQHNLLDEYEKFRNAEPTFSEDEIVSVEVPRPKEENK